MIDNQHLILDGIIGTRKSVDVNNTHPLFHILTSLQQEINKQLNLQLVPRMQLHVELIADLKDLPLRIVNLNALQNTEIDLCNRHNWGFIGKAFALMVGPQLSGQKNQSHVTVAYFGNVDKPNIRTLHKIVENVIGETLC